MPVPTSCDGCAEGGGDQLSDLRTFATLFNRAFNMTLIMQSITGSNVSQTHALLSLQKSYAYIVYLMDIVDCEDKGLP